MDAETMLAVAKAIANATTGIKNLGDGDRVGAAASFTAAAQNVFQELIKAWGTETAKSMLKLKPTLVLENAIAMTALVELINGWSVPEKGSVLTDSSKLNFTLALEKLKAATPDPQHWSGKASVAYSQVNKDIIACVQEVIAADAQLQTWMQAQSEQVLYTRRAFSYTKAGLVGCLPVAWGIYLYTLSSLLSNPFTAGMAQGAALTATRTFQYTVSVGALGTLIGFASDHIITVGSMSQFDSVATKYDAARNRLFIPETAAPQVAAPTAAATVAPTFRSPTGTGNFPITSPKSYPVAGAKPYPVAGSSAGRKDGATKDPLLEPETPATPFTPAAMSAAASMLQSAGQGSQSVGQAIQGAVSQATSAIQQPATPGGKAHAEQPGKRAEAAGGPEGAERAPIEELDPEHARATRSTP